MTDYTSTFTLFCNYLLPLPVQSVSLSAISFHLIAKLLQWSAPVNYKTR